MTGVLSGGIIYEYAQEDNDYGLALLNENGTANLLNDFYTLKTQYASIDFKTVQSIKATTSSNKPPKCDSSLISNDGFNNNFTLPVVPDDGSKDVIEKGVTLKESADDQATVIASGIMVDEALKAYETLEAEGIKVRVIDMFTWKPIDEELIVKSAKETGAIVTAENHNCTCGLGSAVARVLSEQCPTPVEMVGVHDQFGQVGAQNFLQEAYKLTAEEIVANVKKVIARK